MTTAYLGLDLHATTCTLGTMASDGTYLGHQQFPTSESELIPRVVGIDARHKHLAVEVSSLSRWAARTLDPYVDKVLVCDPRENRLVSQNARKSDAADAYALCQLLRLGELHEVYQSDDDHRAVFKAAAIIQTPHRFKTKQKLWRYSQLCIRSKTSNGKPLGYEELDPNGRSELKALSYRAWLAALRHSGNEVETFFQQSLRRTNTFEHAT